MDSCSKTKRAIPDPRKVIDPFSHRNNILITNLYDDGSVDGELTVTPESLNPHGIVHGGCLATLADTVAGHARPDHARCVTKRKQLLLPPPPPAS